jgi:uncharacterized membrane protein
LPNFESRSYSKLTVTRPLSTGGRSYQRHPTAVERARPRVRARQPTKGGVIATIEETIDVEVPVSTAYNQWTQFEEFPEFMEGVESVQQVDDTHLLWTAEIGGKREEWRAEITEQHPDHRVAWRSTDGPTNAGVVTFHRLDDATTRVSVQMDWEPEGAVESAGAALGADSRRVQGDLKRFKEFVERRGAETGAWRGNVDEPGSR